MSKRRIITLISLVVVLGLVIGAFFVIKSVQEKKAEENDNNQNSIIDNDEEKRDPSIFDIEKDLIEVISIERDGEVIEATKSFDEEENEVWSLTSHPSLTPNQSTIKSFVSSYYSLADVDYIGEVDNISDFGLDNPSMILTAKTSDNESYVLWVGDMTPSKDGYYVTIEGKNDVHIIADFRGEKFDLLLKDMVDKTLTAVNPQIVNYFSIKRKGEDRIVAVEKTKEEKESMFNSFNLMKVIEPILWDGEMSRIVEGVTPLLSSTINEFVEFAVEDYKPYSLDEPLYEVEIGDSEDQMLKLQIGGYTEDKTARYAKFMDDDNVFTLLDDGLGFIDMPLEDIMSSFIAIVNIKDVDTIDFKAEGYEVFSKLEQDEEDSDNDKFYVNGMDGSGVDEKDSSYFRKYYQSLLSIFVYDFDFDATPEGPADMTITYGMKDGSTHTIEYIKRDDYLHYALVDGVYSGTLVRSKDFEGEDGVFTTLPKLLDNLEEIEE